MAATYGKLKCSGAGGSLEYPITRDATKIGRSPEKNDVVLNDSGVSRWHCRVTCEVGADYCTVTDLSSANGTHVNGARVEESILRTGDQVQIGDTFLTFIAPVAPIGFFLSSVLPLIQLGVNGVKAEPRT